VSSLVRPISFWSWSRGFGTLIDLMLIALAVLRPEWTARIA
jgi:hypothetical protein